MANTVPEKLINYKVYNEGFDVVGLADVELPNFEAMTETIKGAGIAGEIDSPTLGHYGSMSLTLNWRTITSDNAGELLKPKAHQLELRAAQQNYNAGDGEYAVSPAKIVVKATPKTTNLGKLEVGAMTETSTEFEISYIKITIDNKEIVELDKYNYICRIKGIDYMADTRAALGLQ